MLTGAKRYLTFYGGDDSWMLFDGIGPRGALLATRSHPRAVIDFGAGLDPVLWMCRPGDDPLSTSLERVRLPGLVPERVTTLNARLTAIAVSSDGQRIAAIAVVPDEGQSSGFQIWDGRNWRRIPAEVKPDIFEPARMDQRFPHCL